MDAAMRVADRLRKDVEEARYLRMGEQSRCVTASFGVAEIAGDDKSFEVIMNRADHAMYQAKAAGRNRVCGTNGIILL